MRILLVGASGTLGTALHSELVERKHDVVTVSRTSGDLRYDVSDPAQVAEMYRTAGPFDAVASAAGHIPFGPVSELTVDDYQAAMTGKVLPQILLVREGLAHVTDSFTLITGMLAREAVPGGAAAALANGALEGWVRTAAVEIAPKRVNAISPTVFTESLDAYGDFFPGLKPVPLAEVTRAYVRSIEGRQTGQVYVP
ncbi:short chain dehydrogenase [Lentzea sp. NPDC058450]|uniref:short chain dehydrogenase n=1 Tax=Lentzea sp. NPDC058450 TaxID=3346505 RepID=UPI003653AD0E